ncbi:30S ribosomal protein S7 [candidate division WWE3 bacterium CG_4_8_14_3_um_filter_42_11]|uniref:Small ribosomal subunit protein uS7 n=1 Tax=candidate division WWE3 bacterium CG_4_8_14_3_um_filter_42_11 TaxID=1975076 RepID=A0A2M8G804_UNCKA|nr:MAG: 30S ribosomal protein S7 [candidate division WWE3 bacterium CG_4_8_14_3_um_filter_42_11]
MSRSGKISKRKEIQPDPIYQNVLVSKFINRLMIQGKKSLARKILYQAFEKIKQEQKKDPLEIFESAMRNVEPKLEVRPRRVGGASYQVPMEVRGQRRETLAIRWLIQAARERPNKECHTMVDKLAAEFLAAAQNTGVAVKKREDTHRMSEANKAFAHFRW